MTRIGVDCESDVKLDKGFQNSLNSLYKVKETSKSFSDKDVTYDF